MQSNPTYDHLQYISILNIMTKKNLYASSKLHFKCCKQLIFLFKFHLQACIKFYNCCWIAQSFDIWKYHNNCIQLNVAYLNTTSFFSPWHGHWTGIEAIFFWIANIHTYIHIYWPLQIIESGHIQRICQTLDPTTTFIPVQTALEKTMGSS